VLWCNNPWQAFTLEWLATSPPALKSFGALPLVRGRRPVWDKDHPENADWLRKEKKKGGMGHEQE
jgi:heme/copper-type cytochrome/quinol oxidase subunit 1